MFKIVTANQYEIFYISIDLNNVAVLTKQINLNILCRENPVIPFGQDNMFNTWHLSTANKMMTEPQ